MAANDGSRQKLSLYLFRLQSASIGFLFFSFFFFKKAKNTGRMVLSKTKLTTTQNASTANGGNRYGLCLSLEGGK